MKYLYIPFINGSKRALPTLLRCKLRRTAGRRAGRGRRRGGGRRDGGRCGLRQSYGIAGCAGLEISIGVSKMLLALRSRPKSEELDFTMY